MKTEPTDEPNPTYRCLFPEPPPPGTVPACAEAGILGALPGILGSMMALEVIREIVGFGEGLVGRLVMVDARAMRFETLAYGWDPANPLSGERPSIRDLSIHARVSALTSPRSHRGGAFHDRPFVVAAGDQRVTIFLRAFPGRAEAVLAELPGTLALDAAICRPARASSCRRA